jgi:hypothetical protein
MDLENAPLYVSQILVEQFRRGLAPSTYFSLASMLVRNAAIMDRTVSAWGHRRLAPFPTLEDPPWEHRELLLRTWPELCQLYRSRHGMRNL